MTQLVQVAVENEMDLALAYKKSIKAAGLLGLSISTQTSFATAVSEVCREVIDKTHEGSVSIEIHGKKEPFQIVAIITYKETPKVGSLEAGLKYARKLVPQFSSSVLNGKGTIILQMGIPRASLVNSEKILAVKNYFENAGPNTPYEEVRQRNLQLFLTNEKSELALWQSEYLNEQKNEFLSVASHELRTPLTILKAFTQLALRSECSPVTVAYLKKVDAQATKMQMLIQQLMDISKLENRETDYNKEQTDFNSFLNEIIELIPQLVSSHELMIELDESVIVSIDKLRIEQVIHNIIGNAAKYSPNNRQIRLSSKSNSNKEVIVSIQDYGIGMSPTELHKIFDKFYRVEQVSRKYNGLGMGLYISSKIITDHGGKIWVESVEGSGCTFSFSIPLIIIPVKKERITV
jgi:signal transduction histidine kinase